MLVGIERKQLAPFEKELNNIGFILDKETSRYGCCRKIPGNSDNAWTWHFQFITTDIYTAKEFKSKMEEFSNIVDIWDKRLSSSITFNGGLCEDGRITVGVDVREKWVETEWEAYVLKTGKKSEDFKQYLRSRDIYFEPSQDGAYTHFEVKHSDAGVDEFIETLLSTKEVEVDDCGTKVEDSQHKLNDMNADEIIALIKEAGQKGRSWEWLKGKLPYEFLNLYNRRGGQDVFPIQLSTTRNSYGSRRGVHLTKPSNQSEKIDWTFLKEYLELKKETDTLLDKYEVKDIKTLQKVIAKAYDNEDSISKRALIEKDLGFCNNLYKMFRALESKYGFITDWNKYDYETMLHRDFVFNKKDYLTHINNTWENRSHKENQREFLLKDPYGSDITTLTQKVGMITPEAEAYIRRILKETTTEDIVKKREERAKLRNQLYYANKEDVLNIWKEDKAELQKLLEKFKKLNSVGTFSGLGFDPERPKVVYEEHGGYDYYGRWVGTSKGNYRVVGGTTPSKVHMRGYDPKEKEIFESLTTALSGAMNAKTVAELRLSIEEALEAVKNLPSDDAKIKEAKQQIQEFLEQKREDMKQRAKVRNKKLPDKKFNEHTDYIYLFPAEMSKRDLKALELYDLIYLGKNFFEGDMSHVVKGSKENLEYYADDYLGYQLHPDYLYEEDEFAGDIV